MLNILCGLGLGLGTCVPQVARSVGVDLLQLGLQPATTCSAKELWKSADMPPVRGQLAAMLKPHASLLVRLSDCQLDYAA